MYRFAALLVILVTSTIAYGQVIFGTWPEGGGPLTVSFIGRPIEGVRFFSGGNNLSTGSDPSPFSMFIEGNNQSGLSEAAVINSDLSELILEGVITFDISVASGAPADDITGEWGTGANASPILVERMAVPEPNPSLTLLLVTCLAIRKRSLEGID